MSEPQTRFAPPIRRVGGRGRAGGAPNGIGRKKLYSNFNYIGVHSFILNGAPFYHHCEHGRPMHGTAAVLISID
jgi:hypothetical protein